MLHVFTGPIDGHTYLVVVDAFTKWVEVHHMTQATSEAVINVLRSLFATYDLPKEVLSDSGTAFVSSEIKEFYTANGVQAITSAAYHPATSVKVECYVAEFKRALLQDNTNYNAGFPAFCFGSIRQSIVEWKQHPQKLRSADNFSTSSTY